MSSLDKMVSPSKKKMSVSKSVRVSTTKINSDGVLLRNIFNGKLDYGDDWDKECGIGACYRRGADSLGKFTPLYAKGRTALGQHTFMGLAHVSFYKTASRFVIENGAPYYNPRSILIINNPDARDVSTTKLRSFIENSSMVLRRYSPYSFICGDFASRLHNKAEASGIRCGFIMCNIWDDNKHESVGHAFNVFCGLDGKGNPVPIFADMTKKSHVYLTESSFKKYCSDVYEMEIFV